MTIVMGLDQHRAQITAEWLDTATGEVMRTRIAPAHRAGVRRFCERFHGEELEVALEATTGWRFVADEFRPVGASVHLAEPAETSAMRGNKKRAKSDRAMPVTFGSCLVGVVFRSRGFRRSTSWISGRRCGCGTRSRISVASGSSGFRRFCITTAARNAAI